MADQTHSPVGSVVALSGEARVVSESGTRDLSVGSEIFQGDTIITEAASNLEISFQDNTTFSQGESAKSLINAYVYDPEDSSASDLLLEMSKGVFRTVTGEIAKQNPDNFKLKSPMALIGIRGTVVNSEIQDAFEKIGVETIGQGHVLVIQDSMGNIQFISDPMQILDVIQGRPLSPPRAMNRQELNEFHRAAPSSMDNDPARQAELDARLHAAEAEADAEEASQRAEDAKANAEAAQDAVADAEAALAEAIASGDPEAIAEAEAVLAAAKQALADAEAQAAQAAQDAQDAAEAAQEAAEAVDRLSQGPGSDGEGYEGEDGDEGADSGNTIVQAVLVQVDADGNIVGFEVDLGGEAEGGDGTAGTGDEGTGGTDNNDDNNQGDDDNNRADDNDAPVAQAYNGETGEHAPLAGQLAAIDPDAGDTLTYSLETGPEHGTLVLNEDGSFLYTPDEDHTGTDSFTFSVEDGRGGSDTRTALITVTQVSEVRQGSDAADTLYGLGGDDTIQGLGGNDVIYGDDPSDSGISGDDSLDGGEGNDALSGGLGDDVLAGGSGNDDLDGGAGDDTLDGGGGNDDLSAGTGNDTILASLGNDAVDGGEGFDALSYAGISDDSFAGVEVDLDQGRVKGLKNGGGTLFNHRVEGIERVDGSALDDTLDGSLRDDALFGGDGDDQLYGDDGNDTLSGEGGNNELSGGSGDDKLYGSTGEDTLYGETGDDTLYGGTGKDLLYGGEGNDSLDAGGGDDLLSGGSGNDTLKGGAGDDSLEASLGSDDVDGGEGTDHLSYAGLSGNDISGIDADLSLGTVRGTDTNASDLFTDTVANIEKLTGTSGDDTITGGDGDETLSAGEGNDDVDGGLGDDSLDGGAGDDTLAGNGGDDYFEGGLGNDSITGGSGSDTLDYSGLSGDGFSGINADLAGSAVEGKAGTGTLFTDVVDGIETVLGTDFADTIIGSAAGETLMGAGGNDSLDAGEGNDHVSGEGGDDTLIGGLGIDTLDGGTGTDQVRYDQIADENFAGLDADLSQGDTGVVMGHHTEGGNLFLDYVTNIEELVGSDHDDTIKGNDADNTFEGLSGDDLIHGGGGDDDLAGGRGGDTLYGGEGSNVLDGGDDFDVASYDDLDTAVTVTMNSPVTVTHGDDEDTLENIEYIMGSGYDDAFTGDGRDLIYEGGEGDDTIDGGTGDYMQGGVSYYHDPVGENNAGVNVNLNGVSNGIVYVTDGYGDTDQITHIQGVIGSAGDDTLTGENGTDNWFNPRGGADVINGGALSVLSWKNELSYTYAGVEQGITGVLSYNSETGFDGSYVTDPWGDQDTFSNITRIQGSDYADDLSAQIGTVMGGEQYLDFYLLGMAGDDTLAGTAGKNTGVSYLADPDGVQVDLGAGTAEDGWGDHDTLSDFSMVQGSDHNDTLTGLSGSDSLYGEGGNDNFYGTLGDDSIDGGSGSDSISYEDLSGGTLIGLDYDAATGVASMMDTVAGALFDDTLTDVETVKGSDYNDTMTGDQDDVTFYGNGGNDSLTGGEGDDYLSGDAGEDTLKGDLGDDALFGGLGDDTLFGGGDNDTLCGGQGNDSLTGDEGYDVFAFYNATDPSGDANNDDFITDFEVEDESNNPGDILKFVESSLGFSSEGENFGIHMSGAAFDPNDYQIVAVKSGTAFSEWENVASIIDLAIDADADLDGDAGTYVLISNGEDSDADTRVYYWEGNTDVCGGCSGESVDSSELYLVATLDNIDKHDLYDFSSENFDVVENQNCDIG